MATHSSYNGGSPSSLPLGTDRIPRPAGLLTTDELRDWVKAGRIDTVRLVLPDMQGRLKGKRFDAQHFLDRIAHGSAEACAYILATDVDMRPLDGFSLTSWDTGQGDLRLVPDLDTLRTIPWMPRTAIVLGKATGKEGQTVEVAPRQMLCRQLDALAELGIEVRCGLETEFVLYHGTYAQAVRTGYTGLEPAAGDNLDYAIDHPPHMERYLGRLPQHLAGAGLPVEALKTESGLGQVEITFPYGGALAAADGHIVFKHAARALAEQANMSATFMAAPETGTGSGLHLHLSLWREGRPVLAEDGALSETGRAVVAGLLEGLPSLAPLYAPNTNSYKRFLPHSFAPIAMTWGRDNRTCAIRIAGHGENTHLENRVPGADANPYLALAATLAAARQGLTTSPALPPECTGNAYLNTAAPRIPTSLDEARTAFETSEIAHCSFGPSVVDHYVHAARSEADALRDTVTDAERRRYFARA